jgi:hypothetical protein
MVLLDELNGLPNFLERYKHLLVDFDDEGIKTQVLYFKEKGYQRKGMSSKFYKEFKNDTLYFEQKIVKKAYHYLEADQVNSLKQLQQNFKKNFIENFVEGESIFFASW